jgi:hypothetical protein
MELAAELVKSNADADKMKDLEAKAKAHEESCKDFKPEDEKDCK